MDFLYHSLSCDSDFHLSGIAPCNDWDRTILAGPVVIDCHRDGKDNCVGVCRDSDWNRNGVSGFSEWFDDCKICI